MCHYVYDKSHMVNVTNLLLEIKARKDMLLILLEEGNRVLKRSSGRVEQVE